MFFLASFHPNPDPDPVPSMSLVSMHVFKIEASMMSGPNMREANVTKWMARC
jgi:hypothetical protein